MEEPQADMLLAHSLCQDRDTVWALPCMAEWLATQGGHSICHWVMYMQQAMHDVIAKSRLLVSSGLSHGAWCGVLRIHSEIGPRALDLLGRLC